MVKTTVVVKVYFWC